MTRGQLIAQSLASAGPASKTPRAQAAALQKARHTAALFSLADLFGVDYAGQVERNGDEAVAIDL